MTARPVAPALFITLPCLVLALLGLAHPQTLTPETARVWLWLHIMLLPLFPLLGLCLWRLLRGVSGFLAWAARVLAFLYIAFYGALDVLAGIGTGLVMQGAQELSQSDVAAVVRLLFVQGNMLAEVGVWAFLVACLLTVFLLYRRSGASVLPGGLVLIAAAVSFLSSHIYFPRGVVTMLVMALGFALLSLARPNLPQA